MGFHYLNIIRSPTPELLEILNNNVIGTPGHGMLYQHLGVDDKICQLENPHFVNLIRAGKIVGTCCFCGRTTLNNGQKIRAFYVRYFTFKNAFRRKSINEKIRFGKSGLRKEIDSLLSAECLGMTSGEKFFHYAYVDPRNKRSALLCKEFGFEPIREYSTLIFSRLNPKMDLSGIVEAQSEETVKELLKTFYQGFTSLSFENLSGRKYYFIKNGRGQIVAGALVNPDRWKIHSLPGQMGKIVLEVFSRTPFLNRLLNKDFRFITLEGIYFTTGHEKYLEQLFESLLAIHKVNSAICVVDPEGILYTTLKSLRLGLLNKLKKEIKGNIICRFVNFSEIEKKKFKESPAYISGIDVT